MSEQTIGLLFGTMTDLSDAFIKLRNAAIGRDGKPTKGTPQALADDIDELVGEFQLWSTRPEFLISSKEWQEWTDRHNGAAMALKAAGVKVDYFDRSLLEEAGDLAKEAGKAVVDVAKATGEAAGFGLAVVIAFFLLSQGSKK